jgi:hypothetical protein
MRPPTLVKLADKAGPFPVVEVGSNSGKRIITVFGFTHGYQDDFRNYGKEVSAMMDREIARFRQGDYILVEGYETEIGRRVYEKVSGKSGEDLNPADHIEEALIKGRSRLRLSERFEWYTMFPLNESDLRLIQALGDAKSQGVAEDITDMMKSIGLEGDLEDFFRMTCVDLDTVRMWKERDVESMVRISGRPEEDVRQYIEMKTTFRSLMAARTALWRSELMDVKLFVGCLHAGEVVHFLTDDKAEKRYADSLPEHLHEVFLRNERYNLEIIRIFHNTHEQALDKKLLPLYLRWLAYKTQEMEYNLNPSRSLDFGDYRKQVISMMMRTERDDPCICHSGEDFGNCCAHLLDGFLAVEALCGGK